MRDDELGESDLINLAWMLFEHILDGLNNAYKGRHVVLP